MSLECKSGCTEPNNQKSRNPYVTTRGNILVSDCCMAEAVYRYQDGTFGLWDFCTSCLESYGFNWLEVNPKQMYVKCCPYCNDGDIDIAEGVDQREDSIIWACNECAKYWEVDEEGNTHLEVEE